MADQQGLEPRVRRGIHGAIWWLWRPMSWLLPALFGVHGVLFTPQGFLAGPLMMASVIVVPVLGLLGMLPQKMLQERGFGSMPGPLSGLLLVHWWSGVTLTLTMTDFTWAGEPTSVLRTALGVSISEASQHEIFVVAAVVGLVSWIAIMLLARTTAVTVTTRPVWGAVAWVMVFVGPALVIAAVANGAAAFGAKQDSAGDSRSVAMSRTLDEERTLAHERYTQQQERLSAVRAAIVGGVWQAQPTVIDGCPGASEECYRIAIDYVYTPDGPVDVDEVRRVIAEAGWDIAGSVDGGFGADRIEASDGAGRMLVFDAYSNGSFTLELHSESWWIAPESFRAIATGEDVSPPGDLYAPDAWPELDLP